MTDQHAADMNLINKGAAAARQLLAQIEEAQREQPAKLADMRRRAAIESDRCRVEEPWLDHVSAIPSYMTDGEVTELHGMLAMPSIAAKEIWGCRLAFDVVSTDRPANDVIADYFNDIRDPEHLMLVFAAAIDTLADHIIKPMIETVETHAGDYEQRVRLADAARNAWAARITEIGATQ